MASQISQNPYDYSKHFDAAARSSVSITPEAIEKQKDFAKQFLIAQIKNQLPDGNTDFTKTIELIMHTVKMEQDATSLEIQSKQLDVSKGILFSGLRSFIGTEVESSDSFFRYDDNYQSEIRFEIPSNAIDAQIIIEGQNSELFVDQISTLQEEYFWNGDLGSDMKARSGIYNASVKATMGDGTTEIIKPRVKTQITGISIDEKGVPGLLSGKQKIDKIYGAYQQSLNRLPNEILV